MHALKIKLGLVLPVAGALLILLYPGRAQAQTIAHGTITAVDFDGGSSPSIIAGRGVCVQMATASPGFPNGPAGWGCVAISNPLYREITGLLLAALYAQKTCDVYVYPPANPSWQNEVKIAVCYPN